MLTFALVLSVAINGQIETFALDHGLTAADCRAASARVTEFDVTTILTFAAPPAEANIGATYAVDCVPIIAL